MASVLETLRKMLGGGVSRATVESYNGGLPNVDPNVAQLLPFSTGAAGSVKLTSVGGQIRSEPPTEIRINGRQVRVDGFEKHPIVHACIRVVTDIVSAIPLEVYAKRGKNEILLPDSALQKLLDAPSPQFTAKQLRTAFASDFLVYGNALWRISRAGVPTSPPVALRRVNPEGLQVVYADSEGDAIAYTISDHFGRVQTISASDIIHFRDIDLSAPYKPDLFGFPRAASALLSINADTDASRYVRQVIGNDGTPTLAVILDSEVSQEDASALQERWHELMVNRGHRGRASFMGGVKDIKTIGFNLRNLEFPDLRKINREDICAAFGVDPRMIGAGSASNDAGLSGAQYVEARARLVQHTIEPMLSVVEDVLNVWLAPEFGDLYIRFNKDVLRDLIEDDAATSTRIREEWKIGLRSFEESRSALKLSPKPVATDLFLVGTTPTIAAMLFMQSQDILPSQVGQPQQPVAPELEVEIETEDDGTEDDGTEDDGTEDGVNSRRVLQEEVNKDVWRAISSGVRVFSKGTLLAPEQRAALWHSFDDRAKKEESAYRNAAMVRFNAEKASVVAMLKDLALSSGNTRAEDTPEEVDRFIAAAKAKIAANYRPGAAYHRAWQLSYESLIAKTLALGAENMASSLGISFSISNPRVQNAIRQRVTKLAGQVTETTRARIVDALVAGRDSGMGMGQIADLVEKAAFGIANASRATTIARTETIGAMNEGEFLLAKEAEAIVSKEWLSQQDDRVRPSHESLDGKRISLEEEFLPGLKFPGDDSAPAEEVVNCRCTLLFYSS